MQQHRRNKIKGIHNIYIKVSDARSTLCTGNSICQLNCIQQSKQTLTIVLLVIRCVAVFLLLLLAYIILVCRFRCVSLNLRFHSIRFCLRVLGFISVCVCVLVFPNADLAMIILLLCIWYVFGQCATCIFVCGFQKTGIIAISHTYFVF